MDTITQFDGNLLIGIQHALNADWLTPVMKFITAFGEHGIFWILVCLGLLAFRRTRRIGIICSLSLFLTFICCNGIIKPLVNRTRPFETFSAVKAFLPHPGDASFPSGHTANSMGPAWGMFLASLPARIRIDGADGSVRYEKDYDMVPCLGWRGAGVSARTMHRWSKAAIVLTLLIGLSRLYLGMHYPGDVLAAIFVGMICATIVVMLVERFEEKHGIIGKPLAESE